MEVNISCCSHLIPSTDFEYDESFIAEGQHPPPWNLFRRERTVSHQSDLWIAWATVCLDSNVGFIYLFSFSTKNVFKFEFVSLLLTGPPGPPGKRGKRGIKGDQGQTGSAVMNYLLTTFLVNWINKLQLITLHSWTVCYSIDDYDLTRRLMNVQSVIQLIVVNYLLGYNQLK